MKQQESFEFQFSNEEMEKFIEALKDAQKNYKDKKDVSYNIKLSRVGQDLGMEIGVHSIPEEASKLREFFDKALNGEVSIQEITEENKDEIFSKLKNLLKDKLENKEASLLDTCKENEERLSTLEEEDLPNMLKGIRKSQEQIDNLVELFNANGKKLPKETLKISEATKRLYGTMISKLYSLNGEVKSAESRRIISTIIDIALDHLQVLKSFK